jgi:hypothetical protein
MGKRSSQSCAPTIFAQSGIVRSAVGIVDVYGSWIEAFERV